MARKTRTLPPWSVNPLALCIMLAAAPQAATLGELQLYSRLGQPLDARIRIYAQPDEALGPDCVGTTLLDGGDDGALRRTVIELNPDRAGGALLTIVSDGAVLEPIARLAVRLRCHGAEVRRDYTFLLDPPDAATVAAIQPALTSGLPATRPTIAAPALPLDGTAQAGPPARSLYGMARQRYPRQPDARRHFIAAARALNPDLPADRSSPLPDGYQFKEPPPLSVSADPLSDAKGNWAVKPGESLYAIARKMYPDQPARKKALIAALRRLNPDMPRDGEKALPPGSLLLLPDSLDMGSIAALDQTAAAPLTQPQAASARQAVGTLEISRTETLLEPTSAGNPEALLNAREQALLDQASEQQARLLEAQNRIEKLEKRLGWLSKTLDERDAAQKLVEQKAKPAWMELGVAVLGASLLTAGIMGWLGRRGRRRNRSDEADRLSAAFAVPQRDPFDEEYDASAMNPDTVSRYQPPPEPDVLADTQILERSPLPAHTHSPQVDNMDVFELNSAASEAAVLAAYGQVDRAIALLEAEIERAPTSVINWMQLLEILYNHREVDRFLLLATDFRQHFASESMWKKVRRMGMELAPKAPLFNDTQDEMPFAGLGDSPAPTEAEEAADAAAQAAREAALAQPLVFKLDRSATAIGEPEKIDAIRLPTEVDFEIDSLEAPPLSEFEYAKQLINHGEREAGAAILERILMEGTQEEKLAAADLLVRLTSPT